MKKYEGPQATIVGEPFATRLDKAYPRSSLTRKHLRRTIEASNNARMLGYGRAVVNGRRVPGFYFRATDQNAKGVAWNAAVNVYHARRMARDMFFAHDSRIGTKIKEEDVEDEDSASGIEEKVGTDLIQRALRALGAGASEKDVAKSLHKSGVRKEDAFLAIKAAKILMKDMMREGKVEGKPTVYHKRNGWFIYFRKVGGDKDYYWDGRNWQIGDFRKAKRYDSKAEANKALEAALKEAEGIGLTEASKPLPPLHKWPVKIVKGGVFYQLHNFKVTEKGEPPGSGLYEYELFYKTKSAGKFNNQREVVAKAEALRGK